MSILLIILLFEAILLQVLVIDIILFLIVVDALSLVEKEVKEGKG
jgi:hypothetical protein